MSSIASNNKLETVSLCTRKSDRFQKTYTKQYNKSGSRKVALVKALHDINKKTRKVKACERISDMKSKRVKKCADKKAKYARNNKSYKLSGECRGYLDKVKQNYASCVGDVFKNQVADADEKLKSIGSIMMSRNRRKRFEEAQCKLVAVVKILNHTGIRNRDIMDRYARKLKKHINPNYGKIFFETVMNDGLYERNIAHIFFSDSELKGNIVYPFIETMNEFTKVIKANIKRADSRSNKNNNKKNNSKRNNTISV